jgi:type IV pilus assembly protein PilW
VARRAARGFSLVELMVALSIGLLLCAAFIAVLQRCRSAITVNESLARLQDGARLALDLLAQDLEHAGFFGFAGARAARFERGGLLLAEGDALRQPDGAYPAAPVTGLPTGAHDCGTNLAVDVFAAVQATNNAYPPSSIAPDCAPTASAGGARVGADTLTVRHASQDTVDPHAGRVQVYSRNREGHGLLTLFADGQAPGPVGSVAQIRDLEVRRYYIANSSVERRGWPALRVKVLTEAGGAAQFRDDEVLPGVEDLQVEFGVVDPAAVPWQIRFVPPDFPQLREQRLVAVRLWLRVRADSTERGYRDTLRRRYADADFTPSGDDARHRRVVIERTVTLRNAPLS